jgi:hypothetical protein
MSTQRKSFKLSDFSGSRKQSPTVNLPPKATKFTPAPVKFNFKKPPQEEPQPQEKEETPTNATESPQEEDDTDREEILGYCEAHNKLQECLCVTCRCRVCERCALFGVHKGHDV